MKIEDEKIMFALQDEILNELKITRNINGAKND
jgi:putative metalloprotease UPA3_0508